MKKHANIAIFIPHAGCPHLCSFCDQHAISGAAKPPQPDEIAATITAALQNLGEKARHSEIAFFGGSFTAVVKSYQEELLEAAAPFCGKNGFAGIRISTRPDCINGDVMHFLSCYPVTAIELGAQSMDDEVLRKNRRGHTSSDVATASELIKTSGFSLVLQMMTGLYGATPLSDMATAESLAALKPDTMRIYPALTLAGTYLHQLYQGGEYKPQSLDEAVNLSAKLLEYFMGLGINVIRLGLHDGDGLCSQVVAGPYHPAFRELCEGKIMLVRALAQLEQSGIFRGNILLEVSPSDVSKMVGHKKCNISALKMRNYNVKIRENANLSYLNVRICPRDDN